MKKTLLIIYLFFSLFSFSELKGQNPLWTDGTAFTITQKNLELSLFRPAKYGLTKKDELSVHPLAFFVLPHVFYKRRWVKFELFRQRFLFSSRHGIYYPRIALNINNRLPSRFSEAVPDGAANPHSLAIQNEIILSHFLNEPNHCTAGDKLITVRLGFKYAFKFSSYEQPLIYQSVLYRETVVFYPGFVWYVGADIDGHINYVFNYFADLDFYSHGFINSWAIESKFGIMGYSGEHLSGFAGLKLGFSTMPGRNRFLIYNIDFRKQKKHGTNLFKNKIFKHDNSLERDDKYYEEQEKRESLNDSIQ